LVDQQGRLWIGTWGGGINQYRSDLDGFDIYLHTGASTNNVARNTINALMEARNGSIWLGTNDGVDRFDPESGTFIHHAFGPNHPGKPSAKMVFIVYEDRRGNLWAGTRAGGLVLLDLKTGGSKSFLPDERETSIISQHVTSLLEDSTGRFWVGTSQGLDYHDRETGTFVHYLNDPNEPFSLSHNWVKKILEDSRQRIWVATIGGGLNLYNPEKDHFTSFTNDLSLPNSISNNNVMALFEDQSDNIWIGTQAGINIHHPNMGGFRPYQHNPFNPKSLSGSYIKSIFEDSRGYLWVGTDANGLNRLDRETGEAKRYRHDRNALNSLADDKVFALAESVDGQLMIGTGRGGLDYFDPKTERFTHNVPVEEDPSSLSSVEVHTILVDRRGIQWIGTSHGLNRKESGEGFTRIRYDEDNPASLSDDHVSVLYQDREDRLWVGTYGGLNLLSSSDESEQEFSFLRFQHERGESNSLGHDRVLCIYQDKAGVLWVGTYGGGLNRFHEDSRRFEVFLPGKGNSVINGILEDELGQLWISNNQGLAILNPLTGQFRNFDVRDGLSGNEFNMGAYWKDSAGLMYFGGLTGVTALKPGHFEIDSRPVPTVLTDFLLGSRHVLPLSQDPDSPLDQTIDRVTKMTLTHDQRMVTFEFASLDFHAPWRSRYRYKMDNFDVDWIETDSTYRRATYTNMAPGSYTFRVKGSNRDGIWSKEEAKVHLKVTPPLSWTWKTLYGLIALSLVSMAVYLVRQKEKLTSQRELAQKDRATAERLLELDKLKDQFLANTSHELRTPLNGIIGLTESLIAGAAGKLSPTVVENLSMVVSSGNRLAGLVNDILDFSTLRQSGIQLNKRFLDLHALVEEVLTLSRYLAHDKCLELVNAVPHDLPPVLADESRLQQVLHNLVGNAIKFTPQGRITLSAFIDKRQGLTVLVEDTGIGIPPEKHDAVFNSFEQGDGEVARSFGGTGLGLAIARQLVVLHGGRMSISSELGVGSVFGFCLPIEGDRQHPMKQETVQSENSTKALQPPRKQETAVPGGSMELRTALYNSLNLEADPKLEVPYVTTTKEPIAPAEKSDDSTRPDQITHLRQLAGGEKVSILSALARELAPANNFIASGVNNLEEELADFSSMLLESAKQSDPGTYGFLETRLNQLADELEIIQRGSLKVDTLVKNLRQASLPFEPAGQQVDVSERLRATIELVASQFEDIRIKCLLDGPAIIQCLQTEIDQVLLILIHNACQAIAEKTGKGAQRVLTIESQRQSNGGVWRFKDTGVGISQEALGQVFNAFYTTKPPGNGSGLGLYTAWRIVEKYRGQLEASSELGVGSTFTLSLPLVAQNQD